MPPISLNADVSRNHRNPHLLRPPSDILRRAAHLPPADQSLLRLALDGVHSYRQLGQLFGLSAGHACRRVHRLLQRLRHPVVIALLDFPANLSDSQRQIGLRYFLHRQSAAAIARQFQCPVTQIRAEIDFIRGWARSSNQLRTLGGSVHA